MTTTAVTAKVESAVQRFAQLKALEDAWRAAHPKEGGRHALNGFRFQLLCTLERLIAGSPDGDGAVAPETLADILESNEEAIVVTEAKVGLSSAALSRALDQLWSIHKLALLTVPDLIPSLKYKVVYYKEMLADPEAVVRRWFPGGAVAEEAEGFRRKVEIARAGYTPNQIAAKLVNSFGEKDPFGRIDSWLGELVQASDAGRFVQACERIRIEALALWKEARSDSLLFHVWTSEDQPPAGVLRETAEAKQVLTGQRVHLHHLREGRFANRARYRSLHRDAEVWLANLDRTSRDRLDALWIAGRSGSGKSISLLHLLAALHAEDPRRVILWLGDQAQNIEDALRWALPLMEAGVDVFIGADDPYQSGASGSIPDLFGSSLRLLQNRAETAAELRMPVLFFCGPPEQQEAFSEETTDDLQIQPYEFPPENAHDITELKEWYLKRTGKADLSVEDEGVLLVQLFFEWEMGEPIGAFARRLKARLANMMDGSGPGTAFDLVARILALRRLYVPYPIAALNNDFEGNPNLERAFFRLAEKDHHFEFVAERGVIRFTHPHLADAIYRTWFGASADVPFRASHLKGGIRAWWDSSRDPRVRLVPLWAIEGMLAAKGHDGWEVLAPRWELIEPVVSRILESEFVRQMTEVGERIAYLSVWARLEARLGTPFQPSAREQLIAAVEAQIGNNVQATRGFPLACRTLIRLAESPASVMLEPVRKVLNTETDWFHWLTVALEHGKRFCLDPIADGARAFAAAHPADAQRLIHQILMSREMQCTAIERAYVVEWMRLDSAADPASIWHHGFLISSYLDVIGIDEDILGIAQTFLDSCPQHDAWSYIWENLWKLDRSGRGRLAAKALPWLRKSEPSALGWEFILERLVEDKDHAVPLVRAMAIGRRWLVSAHPDSDPWSRVWAILWEGVAGPARVRLRAMGLQWLHGVHRKGWTYVWESMWAEPDGPLEREKLRSLGLQYLESDMRHGGWSYVWELMWDDPQDHAEHLRAVALEYFQTDGIDRGWHYVWDKVWHDRRRPAEHLRTLGLQFLQNPPSARVWSAAFQELARDSGVSSEHLWDIGIEWLRSNPWADSYWPHNWKHAWQYLAMQNSQVEELWFIGIEKLEGDHLSTSWPVVWNRLWDWPSSDHVRLSNVARRLLVDHPPKSPEAILRKLEGGAPNLRNYDWSDNWIRRLDASSDPDERSSLLSEALAWLGEPSPEIGGWSKIWLRLWNEAAPGREETLTRLGQVWLDRSDVDHPRWPVLWCKLWDDLSDTPESESLARRGFRFLETGPLGSGHVEVLRRLFLARVQLPELGKSIVVRKTGQVQSPAVTG